MSIKFSILELDGEEYTLPTEMDGRQALLKAGLPSTLSASAVTEINTTVTSDIILTGMQLALPVGRHIIIADTSSNHSNNNGNTYFSLYLDGVKQNDTEYATSRRANQMSSVNMPWSARVLVTVTGSPKTVSIRWRTNTGTAKCFSRSIMAIQIGSE